MVVRETGSSPAHPVPGLAAAPRWDPQPLAYQELQSERTEVPASRLLEETGLGRPGSEDLGTATGTIGLLLRCSQTPLGAPEGLAGGYRPATAPFSLLSCP